MKNKYYVLLLPLLVIFTNLTAQNQSQSHLWSLPNQQIDMTTINSGQSAFSPLPVPIDPATQQPFAYPEGYDGRSAENAHNAMHDENGKLLFFVLDGKIFDKTGYLIDSLWLNNDLQVIKGNTEVCIVPVPNNCNQYYIISAGRESETNLSSKYRVAYSKLDLSQPSIMSNCRLGALVPEVNGHTSFILNDNLPGWDDYVGTKATDNVYLAVTTLKRDNRFLYVSTTNAIFRFKVTPTEIISDSYVIPLPLQGLLVPSDTKGEMEIVPIGNNNYRLACPFHEKDLSSTVGYNWYVIMIVDIDGLTGDAIPGTYRIIRYERSVTDVNPPIAKGLEFSPNGRYLYISHLMSTLHPDPLEYYDVNTSTLTPINGANNTSFDRSQIELTYDQSLYLANGSYLARISDPDNPNFPLNWNPTAVPLNNYELAVPYGTASSYFNSTYLLPDQIDGENYLDQFAPAQGCCKRTDGYACSYTALQGTSVWNANGANPFNAVQEVRIDDELLFPSGSTVYIYNMTFRFEENARMTIEKGAKVYINNTLLTSNECDGVMWQGVSVHGNPNMSHAFTNSSQRGFLNMTNNSEISNAKTGVTLHKRFINGSVDWSNRRGIVTASNSTFRNNTKDVAFLTYDFKNRSTFSNCEFLTTDQLNDGSILTEHVSMFKVRGVQLPNGEKLTDKIMIRK